MKTKLLSCCIAFMATLQLFAVNDFTVDGIGYVKLGGDSVEVGENRGITGDVVIPATVTNGTKTYQVIAIGAYAFSRCSGLTSIDIPNSVTYIGAHAFSDCTGLTSVTIGNSVTSIGKWAFYGCSSLTSVTIPNSVTSIGELAFGECSGLTSPVYNAHVFAFMPTSYSGAYTIADGIESIAAYAFSFCKSLTSVTIPNSVTIIGDGAFASCSDLTSIDIPNSATYIGDEAFAYCTGLTSVTIPNSVRSIGKSAFYGCTGLTTVTIGNSVTSIGESAFYGCTGLTSVTIPSSVTYIGDYAFNSVPNIVYSGMATGSPWGAKSVNGYVDGYLVYSDNTKTTLISCSTSAQGEIVIPDSVTCIGESAFYECLGLTSVTIPNSVTSIGDYAFMSCAGLTSVTIPNSVTSIGHLAFYNCSGLTSVTIPNSVTSIGDVAFYGCRSLTSVTNFANTPQEITSSVFNKVDKSTCVLYVPAGSISVYQSADVWKDFTNILPIGAQPADVTTTTVTPSATTADIAWPQVTGAVTYTIEIKKNGELICTLTFNAQGQLISIAFNAPSRNNAPQRAQAAGFSFTVTSLDSGTTYSYTMTAKGNSGNVLKTESGTFTTGEAQGVEDVLSDQVQSTKLLHNGQIFILRGEKEYTLTGQEVK